MASGILDQPEEHMMAVKKDVPRQQKKRPYRAPRLATFGTLTALTKAKGGNRNDSGSPKTRNSGSF
jgi:hypothetical protein